MSRKSGYRFPAFAKPADWRSLPRLHAASAGEARSEKDMRQGNNLERIPILSKRDAF